MLLISKVVYLIENIHSKEAIMHQVFQVLSGFRIKTQEFSIIFSATNVEKSVLYANIFLYDELKEGHSIIGNQIYTYSITRNDFLQLDITLHSIRIEVTDVEHATL